MNNTLKHECYKKNKEHKNTIKKVSASRTNILIQGKKKATTNKLLIK